MDQEVKEEWHYRYTPIVPGRRPCIIRVTDTAHVYSSDKQYRGDEFYFTPQVPEGVIHCKERYRAMSIRQKAHYHRAIPLGKAEDGEGELILTTLSYAMSFAMFGFHVLDLGRAVRTLKTERTPFISAVRVGSKVKAI
jgi:hypothetical protein